MLKGTMDIATPKPCLCEIGFERHRFVVRSCGFLPPIEFKQCIADIVVGIRVTLVQLDGPLAACERLEKPTKLVQGSAAAVEGLSVSRRDRQRLIKADQR